MKTGVANENELSLLIDQLGLNHQQDRRRRVDPVDVDSVHGGRLLARCEQLFARFHALSTRLLPASINPFSQPGAVANTCFLIAVVTGVLLLFWYSASVYSARDSVLAMDAERFGGGLVRTLHRYSSDACIFFVLFHAIETFTRRRMTGARWLPWTTGFLLLGVLIFVGWLGYWLVWDERARQIALGSARLMDALPIFADPLSRSFLTDGGVNTLLFFVVFFVHMLVPLAMAVGLWLHIVRIARARFLPSWRVGASITVTLIALSLIAPADTAPAAQMQETPAGFAMDWWYLWPMALTDRLGAGALWGIFIAGGIAGLSLPWTMARKKIIAAVTVTSRCNACNSCFKDCPYGAITMVPRTDGKHFLTQSQVDPALCVGCGVCAGSCCSAGIGMPQLEDQDVRARLDRMIGGDIAIGREVRVAFLCGGSGAAGLELDEATGLCAELPGYRAMTVPCAGWVPPVIVDHALRAGAAGVLIAACGEGTCASREGDTWTEQRMAGAREPELRDKWIAEARVAITRSYRHDRRGLIAVAQAFGDGRPLPVQRRAPRLAGAALMALVAGAIVFAGSVLPYAVGGGDEPLLVVSFKHPGQPVNSRQMSAAEMEALPVHMRPIDGIVVERRRAAVRLRVEVDGELFLERAYQPHGIWSDGNSIALLRVPMRAGRHLIAIAIGESEKEDEWQWRGAQEMDFVANRIRVVLFDKVDGIRWHE